MRLPHWTTRTKWIALALGVLLVWGSIMSVGFLVFSDDSDEETPSYAAVPIPATHPPVLAIVATPTPTPTPKLTPTASPTPTPVVTPIIIYLPAATPMATPTPPPIPAVVSPPIPPSTPTPTPSPTPMPPPTPSPILQEAEAIELVADWRETTYYNVRIDRSTCSASWNGANWEVTCASKTGYPCQFFCRSEFTACLYEATLTIVNC